MIISQTSQYALKALVFIFQNRGNRPIKVKELSESIKVSKNYLSKILHILTRRGILKSSTGKFGGFELAISPDELLVYQIIEPFESSEFSRVCLLGQPVCSDKNPCSAHNKWKLISDPVRGFFNTTTLQGLMERRKKRRINSPKRLSSKYNPSKRGTNFN